MEKMMIYLIDSFIPLEYRGGEEDGSSHTATEEKRQESQDSMGEVAHRHGRERTGGRSG